jgi:hypothetical protein
MSIAAHCAGLQVLDVSRSSVTDVGIVGVVTLAAGFERGGLLCARTRAC